MLHHRTYSHALFLAAISIAGLLAPRSSNAQQEVVALHNMQTMANALEVCLLDTTYYVSLENLNDISSINPIRAYDSIQDLGGPYVIIPSDGYFLPRKNLATAFNAWNGPYVSYQTDQTQSATTPYDQGSLLDPWGNPFYLFNPLGLIRGDQGIITLELYGDQFDRYTIVSLGPDGVKSSDDLAYQFDGAVNGAHLTSLHGSGVVRTSPMESAPVYNVDAGTSLTLRGTNFGGPGAGKLVLFGPTVMDDVTTWTNREITVNVPADLTGTDNFKVQLNSISTNIINATIAGGNTGVATWSDY
jgi:hypothetical protein